jgi:hypothetical protein
MILPFEPYCPIFRIWGFLMDTVWGIMGIQWPTMRYDVMGTR